MYPTKFTLTLLASVAASENKGNVAWRDFTTENDEILYTRSTDGGANFDPTINLSNAAGSSIRPAIAYYDTQL